MAITKLNSLAIPASTIVTDDLTYPLTNFSSTGIDDNADDTAITIDSSENVTFSGNVGAGVQPESDLAAGYKHIRLAAGAEFMGADSGSGNWISSNAVFSSSGWRYIEASSASSFLQTSSVPFRWRVATSGTAGSAITWSESMRLTSDGNLGLGTDNPVNNTNYNTLDIRGTNGGQLILGRNTNMDAFLFTESSQATFGSGVGCDLVFKTNSSGGNNEALRLDTGGNASFGLPSVSPIISSTKTLQVASTGNTTLSVRSTDGVNDRSAILELLSSGNGLSKSIILYGDTDTTPSTASPLVIQKYHSGSRTEVGRFNTSGHLVLGASTTAFFRLKSGAGGTNGGIQWMFNTDSTVFGALTLPYDTRATTGLHLHSGYPITHTVPSNKAHKFVTGSSETARIDADGIKFNGNTAASSALDHYEEGAWIPNCTTRSGAFTIHGATYTRIGQQVTVQGYFDWVSNNQNNNGNQFFLGGLPYDLAAGQAYAAGSIAYSGGVDISDWYLVLLPNTDNFYFTKKTVAQNVTNAEVHTSGLRMMIVTMTYITDE